MNATTLTPKVAAALRLARLERCPEIKPFRAGDEDLICGNCSFGVFRISDGTWRHSQNEIRAMRAMAVDRWPR